MTGAAEGVQNTYDRSTPICSHKHSTQQQASGSIDGHPCQGLAVRNLLTEQTGVGVCLLGHHGNGFLVRCMAARWNCIVLHTESAGNVSWHSCNARRMCAHCTWTLLTCITVVQIINNNNSIQVQCAPTCLPTHNIRQQCAAARSGAEDAWLARGCHHHHKRTQKATPAASWAAASLLLQHTDVYYAALAENPAPAAQLPDHPPSRTGTLTPCSCGQHTILIFRKCSALLQQPHAQPLQTLQHLRLQPVASHLPRIADMAARRGLLSNELCCPPPLGHRHTPPMQLQSAQHHPSILATLSADTATAQQL